jgi:hypothetical protein
MSTLITRTETATGFHTPEQSRGLSLFAPAPSGDAFDFGHQTYLRGTHDSRFALLSGDSKDKTKASVVRPSKEK